MPRGIQSHLCCIAACGLRTGQQKNVLCFSCISIGEKEHKHRKLGQGTCSQKRDLRASKSEKTPNLCRRENLERWILRYWNYERVGRELTYSASCTRGRFGLCLKPYMECQVESKCLFFLPFQFARLYPVFFSFQFSSFFSTVEKQKNWGIWCADKRVWFDSPVFIGPEIVQKYFLFARQQDRKEDWEGEEASMLDWNESESETFLSILKDVLRKLTVCFKHTLISN